MSGTEHQKLLQEAKDKALFGYLAVAQRAIQDADKNVVELLLKAKSGPEHSALSGMRHFLRQDSSTLVRHVETSFRSQLERAMQTMYTDLRGDLRDVSASELSLIDDEVVNQQIEVGRLVQRMRDANEESIGRLNIIIAKLHGHVEVRERENPFRPYLLARALFDAVRATAEDEAEEKLIFEHLATALIPHLGSYYAAIRQIFEASGVRASFVAQPSRAAHHQRYFGAPRDAASMVTAGAGAGTGAGATGFAPGLERLIEAMHMLGMQQMTPASGQGERQAAASPHDLIRSMFDRDMAPAQRQQILHPAPATSPLMRQLGEFQKAAMREAAGDGSDAPAGPSPDALRSQLNLEDAALPERVTVEVVATLFEYILGDEQIPAPLRRHIARLQIPVLKAALLESDLLHDESHPARRLLNRMSTVALGTDPESVTGKALVAELERLTAKVLGDFKDDTRVFSDAVGEFEIFMSEQLREADKSTAAAVEAVEAAEKYSVLLTNTTRSLCDVLLPLNVDKSITDFVIAVWPHVLVQAAWQDMQGKAELLDSYRAVLPELLWSVRGKTRPEERSVLMKLLPDLVRRLRAGMDLIQLPEEDSKPLLDQLVAMHTRVLRGVAKGETAGLPELEQLRKEFARIVVSWGRVSWGLSEPPQVRESVVEDVLGRGGVAATLHLLSSAPSNAADRDFLAQSYLLGTRVEIRGEGAVRPAQLVWITTHRSLYLFRHEEGALVLYSAAALLEALNVQSVVPLEYAPVFERAVESLLFGAENIDN